MALQALEYVLIAYMLAMQVVRTPEAALRQDVQPPDDGDINQDVNVVYEPLIKQVGAFPTLRTNRNPDAVADPIHARLAMLLIELHQAAAEDCNTFVDLR